MCACGQSSAAALVALQMCWAAWAACAASARPEPDAPAPLAALLDEQADDKVTAAIQFFPFLYIYIYIKWTMERIQVANKLIISFARSYKRIFCITSFKWSLTKKKHFRTFLSLPRGIRKQTLASNSDTSAILSSNLYKYIASKILRRLHNGNKLKKKNKEHS